MEAVAALAIASIALLGLLQLQLVGIRTADQAQGMTQAVLLAQEKMAEAVSAGYPPVGVRSGMVEAEGDQLTWRIEVTDARAPLPVTASEARQGQRPEAGGGRREAFAQADRLEAVGGRRLQPPVSGLRPSLRKLSVEVRWQKGPGEKHIGLTTYMTENRIREG